MSSIDPLAFLRTYLLTQSTVTTYTSTRIYCEQIPEGVYTGQKMILLRSAGGQADKITCQRYPMVRVWCYGETTVDAYNVSSAVDALLHRAEAIKVSTNVLLRCNQVVTEQHGKDPDTHWDYYQSVYQLNL